MFACHAVDNPGVAAELEMLKKYGPSVDEAVLLKLVGAFGALRSLSDQGLLAYPYSMRELVAMVTHLEKYPDEGIANVVANVFDFDAFDLPTQDLVCVVFVVVIFNDIVLTRHQ